MGNVLPLMDYDRENKIIAAINGLIEKGTPEQEIIAAVEKVYRLDYPQIQALINYTNEQRELMEIASGPAVERSSTFRKRMGYKTVTPGGGRMKPWITYEGDQGAEMGRNVTIKKDEYRLLIKLQGEAEELLLQLQPSEISVEAAGTINTIRELLRMLSIYK